MKKTFAAALLISASLTACGGKKEATTPTKEQPAMEQKGDATGGAAYGKKADGAAPMPAPAPAPADDKASPNAPK
ncbi:MAG TPA: hypothetical protein VHW23_43020 [Kofleriaceae bacterium]|nr:hypothetical protein [Kofleriaceae bacterium]